jgi:hypothetical protein
MSAVVYRPDVVDEHVLAWEAFIASVDPVTVELERVVSPRRVAAVVKGERFGGADHRLMLEDHERSRVRFAQAVIEAFEPVSPVPNRYRVRRGEFWMPVGRRNAERFVVEVVEVSRGSATTYRRGYLRKLPLDMFHGQRGGFERVEVDDVTRRAIRGPEKVVNGAVGPSGGHVASPAHENTSTECNPATGLVASNEVTTEKEAA